jgi:hypothetical protein
MMRETGTDTFISKPKKPELWRLTNQSPNNRIYDGEFELPNCCIHCSSDRLLPQLQSRSTKEMGLSE